MKTFLANGAGSNVYLDTDDVHGEIIIKESRYRPGSQKDIDYISHQLRGYDIVNEIRKSGTDFGVVLPELINVIDTPEYRAIVEKRIRGVDFKNDVYAKLSEEQKETAAHQMALFLNTMHQMQPPKPADKSIKHIFNSGCYRDDPKTTEEFQQVFEGRLAPEYVERISAAEQALQHYDTSDELHVMTHRDLRHNNIMYDENTGQVAIIDFEMAGVDNVYRDFVASSPGSSMSWNFMRRVIRHYNAIEGKKYPITIDEDKVKNALIYGIAHERSRVLNGEKGHSDNKDMDIGRMARLMENKLDTMFGHEEFVVQSNDGSKNVRIFFKRAISKVKKKANDVVSAMITKNRHNENDRC